MTLNPVQWFRAFDNWFDCLPEPRRFCTFVFFAFGWILPSWVAEHYAAGWIGVLTGAWLLLLLVWCVHREFSWRFK